VVRDLLVGDAEDPLALLFERGLALGVIASRNRVVVPGLAVGFEDEVVVGPAEVGDGAVRERLVDLGRREARSFEEVQDEVFEVASGRFRRLVEELRRFLWRDALAGEGFADRSAVWFERQQ
jgi:hypothetical protein